MPHAKAFGNQFVLGINTLLITKAIIVQLTLLAIIIASWGEGLGRGGVNNTISMKSGGCYYI